MPCLSITITVPGMAKREIVTIHCDGPCGGVNPIPLDYDPCWVIGRSDRKYRYVDLCPACSANQLDWLYSKGAPRMSDRPVTPDVRAERKNTHLRQVSETFPPQGGRSVGLSVGINTEGATVTQTGPGIGESTTYTDAYTDAYTANPDGEPVESDDEASLDLALDASLSDDDDGSGVQEDDRPVIEVTYVDAPDDASDDEPLPEPDDADDGDDEDLPEDLPEPAAEEVTPEVIVTPSTLTTATAGPVTWNPAPAWFTGTGGARNA